MSSTEHTFRRYVALGDSQTEGLNDGDDLRGYRGWADRLAERLASNGPLDYANLAVRGKLATEVRAEQLDDALRLRPDLASVMAGVNDVLCRRFDGPAVVGELERMYAELTAVGAKVVTVTFPDPGEMVPAARPLAGRTRALNAGIRAAADRHGVVLADLAAYPVCVDPRLWSTDRLHLNSTGHTLLADAVAHALDLPGVDESWADPLAPLDKQPVWRRLRTELDWAGSIVAPWIGRRLLGRSSGDGRTAKRPEPSPIVPSTRTH